MAETRQAKRIDCDKHLEQCAGQVAKAWTVVQWELEVGLSPNS